MADSITNFPSAPRPDDRLQALANTAAVDHRRIFLLEQKIERLEQDYRQLLDEVTRIQRRMK